MQMHVQIHKRNNRMAIVELNGVYKDYPMGDSHIRALENVCFSMSRGEFVAVWGPSGSGKSTLCNLIGMLDLPTRGHVLFNGRDVCQMTDDMRSEHRSDAIGFIFQDFNLLPVLSALENVMFPLEVKGVPKAVAAKKANALLGDMGIAAFSHHRPHKLSGGQRQRVAIARALITEPVLVIADEPTANLDSHTAKTIIRMMQNNNRKTGTTFLFSTHDRRLLDSVNRKVLLEDGHILTDETNGKHSADGNHMES